MTFDELQILLPCHSLEDFPLYHEQEAAESLLSAWSALWHPALIASAGRTAGWSRADSPPQELARKLLIIPQVSESLLPTGWAARAQSEGAHVVRKLVKREEVVHAALQGLDDPASAAAAPLAPDFLALGYCYLQVELLTRQMRYMSNLDETRFRTLVVEGARAALAGDATTARNQLQASFELLLEARERFYPAQAYLVDLTLVAPSTAGAALREELAGAAPRNLLLSGQTLAALAASEPETVQALRDALEAGRAALIGGEARELEAPLLPLESLRAELETGLALYQQHLGRRPTVFGRRRFGLTPAWPQLLSRFGFEGAVHCTLDDGQFPREGQSKTRWEGLDSSAVDALARVPQDAERPEAFLAFPQRMGEAMDLDHVAMVGFAHWPGRYCPWYDDLRKICEYAPVLGRFVTLPDFLSQTASAGHLSKYTPDQYRAPYLKQAIIRRQADPLSRISGHYLRRAASDAAAAVDALAAFLDGRPAAPSLSQAVEESYLPEPAAAAALQAQLEQARQAALDRFQQALPRREGAAAPGLLVVNPLNFSRRMLVPWREGHLPAVAGPVRGVQIAQPDTGVAALVEVETPAFGYAWLQPGAAAPLPPKRSKEPPLAEGDTLRNEFFECRIDPATGALRSFSSYKVRGNLLSQQVAFRLPQPSPKVGEAWVDPDEQALYTVMVADDVQLTCGTLLGEIASRGRMVDANGKEFARFRQKYQVRRGSPLLSLEIDLEILEEPRADPGGSYYAVRFAWPDETADLYRSVSQVSQPTDAKRLEAPLFLEVRGEKHRLAILTGGLPYHRRMGPRRLDSLLVVRGERQRQFRLGIGLNLPYPAQSAWELLQPETNAWKTAPLPTAGESSWLCHLDQKNVLCTHLSPLVEAGAVVGVRMRLLETEGRPARAKLQALRPLLQARQVDALGRTLGSCLVEAGAATVDMTPHEWTEVEARWA